MEETDNKEGILCVFGDNTEKIPSQEDVPIYEKVSLYEMIEDINKRLSELEKLTKFQNNMIVELISQLMQERNKDT